MPALNNQPFEFNLSFGATVDGTFCANYGRITEIEFSDGSAVRFHDFLPNVRSLRRGQSTLTCPEFPDETAILNQVQQRIESRFADEIALTADRNEANPYVAVRIPAYA